MVDIKERKAFERWLAETYMSDAEWNYTRNCYLESSVHMAWQAWQASYVAHLNATAIPIKQATMPLLDALQTPCKGCGKRPIDLLTFS